VVYPKEILNELKWKPGCSLEDAKITYVHRGAPNDEMTIKGSDITALEHSFFVTTESKIPYHRIKRIVRLGKMLFDSEREAASELGERMKENE
jgi:uncharacterized protein (UPF0248 family)